MNQARSRRLTLCRRETIVWGEQVPPRGRRHRQQRLTESLSRNGTRCTTLCTVLYRTSSWSIRYTYWGTYGGKEPSLTSMERAPGFIAKTRSRRRGFCGPRRPPVKPGPRCVDGTLDLWFPARGTLEKGAARELSFDAFLNVSLLVVECSAQLESLITGEERVWSCCGWWVSPRYVWRANGSLYD